MLVEEKEVLRVPSPGGKFEAVLSTRDGGATTSVVYLVTIVRKGKAIGDHPDAVLDNVTSRESGEAPSLRWRSPRHLEIGFEKARVFSYSNFATFGSLGNVSIALKHPDVGFVP